MNFSLKMAPADARLLPEGRMAGPMPWVIAIMMFLTVLAAAAGLSLGAAARGLSADLAGRLTVQLVEGDSAKRKAGVIDLTRELTGLAAVETVRPVPQAEVAALLDPWFGSDGLDPDLPIPALIDVTLRSAEPADVSAVRAAVRSVSSSARVDEHAQWLAPLADLLGSLKWLSAMLVGLMTAATAAAVVLAARAALNTHRATIEVMHLLGASDVQIARLFQRRIALDALFGGFAGLAGALLAMLVVGNRLSAIGSDLLGSARLGWWGWLLILILPLVGAALSTLAARLTVLNALKRML
jgi:cell division transport system permease protein